MFRSYLCRHKVSKLAQKIKLGNKIYEIVWITAGKTVCDRIYWVLTLGGPGINTTLLDRAGCFNPHMQKCYLLIPK